jgi:hypothetical protein
METMYEKGHGYTVGTSGFDIISQLRCVAKFFERAMKIYDLFTKNLFSKYQAVSCIFDLQVFLKVFIVPSKR